MDTTTRTRLLVAGNFYDFDALALIGWTIGDGTGHESYHMADYFAPPCPNGTSRYLGPDAHGIEPIVDAKPVLVGDFIQIPAWQVEGLVTAVGPSDTGSDDSITVLLQERPDGPERRYRLEPHEYEVIG